MRSAKKVIAIMALLSIVLIMFSACTKPTNQQPGPTTTPGPTATGNKVPDKERVTITYSFWGDNEELKVAQGVVDKYESIQDKVHVELVQIDRADYVGTLNTRAAGKSLPDCGIMAEDAVLMWAEQGMLADIGNMYAAGEAKPLDSLAFTYNGKTVAYSVANEVLLTFYNRDRFDAANVAYPPASADKAWSWDEFVDVAKELTLDANGNNAKSPDFDKNNIKQYGVMLCPDFWQLEVWSVSNGSAWYDQSGNVKINDPAAMEALQRIADLYLVHHVAPQYGSNTATLIDTDLKENCAMYINGQWSVGVWLGPAKNNENLNYGVGVLPYMKDKVTINTGGPNVVFSTSKHQEEAMDWLKWYAKEENAWDLIESGIWMPILSSYYTDEAMTRKWVENPNFPPYDEYKSAVVDYAMKNAKQTSWYTVNNTNVFNDALSTILAPCWSGNAKVADAIPANIDTLKAANKGN